MELQHKFFPTLKWVQDHNDSFISSKCLIIGAEGVGKTHFITRYIYPFDSPISRKLKSQKIYNHILVNPHLLNLEIHESRDFNENLDYSSVLALFNPDNIDSINYLKFILQKRNYKKEIMLVSLYHKEDNSKNSQELADNYGSKLIHINIDSRESVKRCFEYCKIKAISENT